ncbi:MAG: 50S ribosomal protein L4 [Planctomycetota bacterium]
MISVPVYNLTTGEEVEKIDIDPAKLGSEVNKPLLKQALVMYHANKRQGTVQTKARGQVSGSTKKLFRQKGTGNARMGPKRNPIRRGGGHAMNKKPRDFSHDMPKKQRRLASRNALLAKLEAGDVKVVADVSISEPKTKVMAGAFKALELNRRTLVARTEDEFKDPNFSRATRNLADARLTTVRQLNAGDLLNNRYLLISKAGLTQFVEGDN